MGDDTGNESSSGSGGWSTYKRLILRMLEDAARDIRSILGDLPEIKSKHEALHEWVKDIDRETKNDLKAINDRLFVMEASVAEAIGRSKGVAANADRMEREYKDNTAALRKKSSSPGLLIEMWKTSLGKVLLSMLCLAALLSAGALYNLVSERQVDLNRTINDSIPTSEGGAEDASP
jgi:hypothetical protein